MLDGFGRAEHIRLLCEGRLWSRLRDVVILGVIALILASCGAATALPVTEKQMRVPVAAVASTSVPALSPTPRSTQTPAQQPTAAPATARPTSTALPSLTPSPNPFAHLTALALTPTRVPEPPAAPQHIHIPRIGLDAPILPVGLDKRGLPVVLKHDVAWYEPSGRPGAGTNVVLWAHVLRFQSRPKIPAPFARVKELRPGDRISLTSKAGRSYAFAVTAQLRVRPHEVEYMLPTPLERLTLISCIGDNVIVDGELTKTERLVTIAEPIQ